MLIDIQKTCALYCRQIKITQETAILTKVYKRSIFPLWLMSNNPKGLGHTLPELTQLPSEKIRQSV